jgi:hypothetical protein
MRFGSRRNQRPIHHRHRSITTVSAIIDTTRIGHITGPPLRNWSINQLPALVGCDSAGGAAGEGLIAAGAAGLVAAPGAGLSVTGTVAPGIAGCCPGIAGCCPGIAGCCPGARGCCPAGDCRGAWAPGLVPGAVGGLCAGGGDCATNVSASASELTAAMNNVFISLLNQEFDGTIAIEECPLSQNHYWRVQQKFSLFCSRGCTLYFVISLQAGCKASSGSCLRRNSVSARARLVMRSPRCFLSAANCQSLLLIRRRGESAPPRQACRLKLHRPAKV